MSRLFVTTRELNFLSDITKELFKDVIGNFIYYYAINETKTRVHGIYNEALDKVFDPPIKIDCLVDSNFQADTKVDQFGIDSQFKLEVFIQYRDLVDKGINVNIGDYVAFSDVFYEIAERHVMRNIWGLPEHKDGIKLVCTKARESQFKTTTLGPTDIARSDADAVQTTFVQQRGQVENSEGPTADVRDLQRTGILDAPLGGPREVSPAGDATGTGSSFFDEEE